MDDKNYLINEYDKNISILKDELSYHFKMIKSIKCDLRKYELLKNALISYQLNFNFNER